MTALILGLIGMCCILGAFILVQNHQLTADDLLYDLLNAIGSALLMINAILTEAWPFLILNTVWGAYAFKDVIAGLRKKQKRSIKSIVSPLVHKHKDF